MLLLVESRLVIAERDELIQTSSRALSIVEKTNNTAIECLSTLADIRRQLYPAAWETNLRLPLQKGQCSTAIGGPLESKKKSSLP